MWEADSGGRVSSHMGPGACSILTATEGQHRSLVTESLKIHQPNGSLSSFH